MKSIYFVQFVQKPLAISIRNNFQFPLPEERGRVVVLREIKAADMQLAAHRQMGEEMYAGLNGSEPRCAYAYKQ